MTLIKERTLYSWKGLHEAEWLASQCVMKHRQVVSEDPGWDELAFSGSG